MISNILSAIKAYRHSFKLISHLKLWGYFAIPMAISFIVAICIGLMVWGWSDDMGGLISGIWPWDWGAQTFRTIGDIVGGIFILALGLILYKHIVMALSAPFMSPVSEKIEKFYRPDSTFRNTSNLSQLWRGIKINMRNLTWELIFTVLLLLLGLIPIIGLIAPFLLFLVQAYYAGFGNMDYTLERHFGFRQSINFVKGNKGFAIGNGIVFLLFLLIPVLGFIIVLPLSVTAASKTTVELLDSKKH